MNMYTSRGARITQTGKKRKTTTTSTATATKKKKLRGWGQKEIDVGDAKAMQMESYAAEKRILNQQQRAQRVFVVWWGRRGRRRWQ